jgi:hypothetical protein
MLKLYSNVEKDLLLLTVIRKEEITHRRQDLSPETEFLQVSAKKITTNDHFKAHRHLKCEKNATTTQESWVILDGEVLATIYDIDNTVAYEDVLRSGDCIVLFAGGHSLKCLAPDAIMYEFKNGPYYGVEKDKELLEIEDE